MVLYTLCKLVLLGRPPLPLAFGHHLTWIRHQLEPTDEERDAAHLASAADLHELEFRIRELDRPDRHRRGLFTISDQSIKSLDNEPISLLRELCQRSGLP